MCDHLFWSGLLFFLPFLQLAASSIPSPLHLIVTHLPCAASPSPLYPLEHWAVAVVVQQRNATAQCAQGVVFAALQLLLISWLSVLVYNGNRWCNFVRWNNPSVDCVQARCFETCCNVLRRILVRGGLVEMEISPLWHLMCEYLFCNSILFAMLPSLACRHWHPSAAGCMMCAPVNKQMNVPCLSFLQQLQTQCKLWPSKIAQLVQCLAILVPLGGLRDHSSVWTTFSPGCVQMFSLIHDRWW